MTTRTWIIIVVLALAMLVFGQQPVSADGRTPEEKALAAQGTAWRLGAQAGFYYALGVEHLQAGHWHEAQFYFEAESGGRIAHVVDEAWGEAYGVVGAPPEAQKYYSWRVVMQEWPLEKVGQHIRANVLPELEEVEWNFCQDDPESVSITIEVHRPLFLIDPIELIVASMESTMCDEVIELPAARTTRVHTQVPNGQTFAWALNAWGCYFYTGTSTEGSAEFIAKEGGQYAIAWWPEYHWSQDALCYPDG